jgi:hypothetical protein
MCCTCNFIGIIVSVTGPGRPPVDHEKKGPDMGVGLSHHDTATVDTAPGARIAMLPDEDGLTTLEVRATSEGAALIAAGQWLRRQSACGEPAGVEGIDWAPAEDDGPGTLMLTVSQTSAVVTPIPLHRGAHLASARPIAQLA